MLIHKLICMYEILNPVSEGKGLNVLICDDKKGTLC